MPRGLASAGWARAASLLRISLRACPCGHHPPDDVLPRLPAHCAAFSLILQPSRLWLRPEGAWPEPLLYLLLSELQWVKWRLGTLLS